MKIGLSLSYCVQDLILGKVKLEEVQFISTGTCIENDEDWNLVMEGYQEIYWCMNPSKGVQIATQLREVGKIIQPRLEGLALPAVRRKRNHWVGIGEYNQMMRKANVKEN